ncbi:2,3-dihydroxybenzoate-AMP ligase [Evansella caseinilytica]|uniref:2,3-dihydroxybenzoate-AMP ligase n=1 Tax=Evansella caseinilytica TaxID=1503961 RepID=A0A1H3STM2_9BACI|nr:(2,3-dihydroxybenzoyl)adenylate synthase [Evansella caseinilytica]SDZ41090.1 2,3-dihydroxybenzoate-AMP ligase [Evansella caseinilytica]
MFTNDYRWPEEFARYYRREGCWQGITFGGLLRNRAERYGDRTAVSSKEREISYRELDRNADRLAAGFYQLGIRRKDRVVVQLPNKPEFFEIVFALFRLGALPVFALPSHRYNEIRYFCAFTEAKMYIAADEDGGFDYRQLAKKIIADVPTVQHVVIAGDAGEFASLGHLYEDPVAFPDVSSEAIAFFQLSGGSTGLPKLIPRTHDDYIYSLHASAEVCELDEHSVYLAVLPIAHNYPLSSPGVLGTLYAGGKVVLSSGASPDEALPLIEQEQVTITALVPPLALIWLEAVPLRQYDLSSLKVLQVGGAKFNAEAARRVKPIFGCTLQQVYGMAEGLVNYTRLDDPEEIIVHTQGKPMSRYDDIRIVDEEDIEVAPGETGELLTRGPYTIRGYYNAELHNKKAFTADGFYRTGDLVRLTPAGYFVVEGRAKDQINRGGEKIAAEEVENHLLAHDSVHDAAVVAMPDKYLGERSCAFVILRSCDQRNQNPVELKAFLRERGLAAYKIPDRIEVIDGFPKTAVGKVNKRVLRQIIADKLQLHEKQA